MSLSLIKAERLIGLTIESIMRTDFDGQPQIYIVLKHPKKGDPVTVPLMAYSDEEQNGAGALYFGNNLVV